MSDIATLATDRSADVIAFERIVHASPAFDKRSLEPGKNYGIGAMRMWFVLKGPHGAIKFQIGTDWHLPHVIKEWRGGSYHNRRVSAWGIDYHSPKPMYEGHTPTSGECEYVDGGKCYFDVGIGWAEEHWLPGFIYGGTKWLWAELEKEYRSRFLGEEVIYDDHHDLPGIGDHFYEDS